MPEKEEVIPTTNKAADGGAADNGAEVPHDAGDSANAENDPTPPNSEEVAAKKGWVPYKEWVKAGKNPEDWRDSSGYLAARDFSSKVGKLHRENAEQQRVIDNLAQHNRKMNELHKRQLEEAIANKKAAYKTAIYEGNDATAAIIDKEVDDLKIERDNLAQAERAPAVNPALMEEFVSFRERNQWYGTDAAATAYADAAGVRLRADIDAGKVADPGSVAKFYAMVEKQVRSDLPRLNGKGHSAPPTMEGPRRAASAKSGEESLTGEEKAVMQAIIKAGGNKQEYLNDLAALKAAGK